MKPEEAIRILRYEKPAKEYVGNQTEALDMAVEALEKQIPKPVEQTHVLRTETHAVRSDTISRQAAIDAIEHRLAEPAYQHTGEDWYVGMNSAELELYELPSAQPQWIRIEDQKPGAAHVLVTAKWKEDDYEVFELDYGVTKYGAEQGNEWCKRVIDHVIAWMAMPDPYREDGAERR